jgi:hypothetical protein
MSVFDKIETKATGMCHDSDFDRVPASVTTEVVETGAIRPTEYSRQFEHELRIRIASRFWCNKAQYTDARKHAETVLANLLYDDVIRELHGIMHAISDGSSRSALSRCGALLDSLKR